MTILTIGDIVTSLINKEVVVFGNNTIRIRGILIDFNGYVLHVQNNKKNYYIKIESLDAIKTAEEVKIISQ